MTGPMVFAMPSEPVIIEIAEEKDPITVDPPAIKAIVEVFPATTKARSGKQ